MHPATYRILMDGTLPDEGLLELVGMRLVTRTTRSTVLEGVLPDQSALLGMLVRVEDLGCQVRHMYVVRSAPRAPRPVPS